MPCATRCWWPSAREISAGISPTATRATGEPTAGYSCAKWPRSCAPRDCGSSMRMSRYWPRRRVLPRIAPQWPRISQPISGSRRDASTSRPPPRSAWDSSVGARVLPRPLPSCSKARIRRIRPRTIASSAQQYVHRAGAAVDRPCRAERHHVAMATQPRIDRDLQDGAARARPVTLAVNDPDASMPGVAIEREELGELVTGRGLAQAVQIQFIFDGIKTAAQAAQHLSAHAGPPKHQGIGAADGVLRRRTGSADRHGGEQRHGFVQLVARMSAARRAPRYAGARPFEPRGFRRLRQRLHIAYRGAKRHRIIVSAEIGGGVRGALLFHGVVDPLSGYPALQYSPQGAARHHRASRSYVRR